MKRILKTMARTECTSKVNLLVAISVTAYNTLAFPANIALRCLMILARPLQQITNTIGNLPLLFRARNALFAILVLAVFTQSYSLDCALSAMTEETKSAPIEEDDTDAEGQARTLCLASPTCQRRLNQVHAKCGACVSSSRYSAVRGQDSNPFLHSLPGAIHRAVPMRC